MEFILFVGMLIFCIHINNKVSRLEEKLNSGETIQVSKKTNNEEEKEKTEDYNKSKSVSTENYVVTEPAPSKEHNEEKTDTSKSSSTDINLKELKDWLVTDWIFKLGAFLLLVGFGWLTTYAFMNNWIGELGRITLGLVLGALIMLVGEWRIKTRKNQGTIFMVLGSSTVLLTILAARELYDKFTPASALGMMAMVVIFVAISSIINKTLDLAILSLILGAIAPLLTGTEDAAMVPLLSYIFLLASGTIWIIALTGWRILSPLALGVVGLYSLPFMTSFVRNGDERWTALGFAALFAVLFYIANLTAILVTKKTTKSDLFVAAGNGILLLLWITSTAPEELQSFLTATATLIFVAGAFAIFKMTEMKNPVYLYSGMSICFLGAATAFELSGPALTIAYSLEIAFLSFFAVYLTKKPKIGQALSLLLSIPIIMSLESLNSYHWKDGILHDHFFVIAILGVITLALGVYFRLVKDDIEEENKKPIVLLTVSSLVLGGFYFMSLIWLSLHSLIKTDDIATMISLTIYTIFGLFLYIVGKVKDLKGFAIAGGVLLGLVIARLLLVEIWDMDIAEKIVTFFVIGALLISTAFIKKQD